MCIGAGVSLNLLNKPEGLRATAGKRKHSRSISPQEEGRQARTGLLTERILYSLFLLCTFLHLRCVFFNFNHLRECIVLPWGETQCDPRARPNQNRSHTVNSFSQNNTSREDPREGEMGIVVVCRHRRAHVAVAFLELAFFACGQELLQKVRSNNQLVFFSPYRNRIMRDLEHTYNIWMHLKWMIHGNRMDKYRISAKGREGLVRSLPP